MVPSKEQLRLSEIVAEWMGMPWRRRTLWGECLTCGWDLEDCQCRYAVDVGQAWKVMRRLHEEGSLIKIEWGSYWWVTVSRKRRIVSAHGKTFPEAVCRVVERVVLDGHLIRM